MFPLNLLLILLCAELSFWLIERPCLRLRSRLAPQRVRLANPAEREAALLDPVAAPVPI